MDVVKRWKFELIWLHDLCRLSNSEEEKALLEYVIEDPVADSFTLTILSMTQNGTRNVRLFQLFNFLLRKLNMQSLDHLLYSFFRVQSHDRCRDSYESAQLVGQRTVFTEKPGGGKLCHGNSLFLCQSFNTINYLVFSILICDQHLQKIVTSRSQGFCTSGLCKSSSCNR